MSKKRAPIVASDRSRLSSALCQQLAGVLANQNVARLASYYPAHNEIAALDERLAQTLFLPVIVATTMVFVRWRPGEPLAQNRFGIYEPRWRVAAAIRSLASLDAVLLPLLACDRSGNRVGYGGGYYDRALAGTPRPWPLLIGCCYDWQLLPSSLASLMEPHDCTLDYIVTPGAVVSCKNERSVA